MRILLFTIGVLTLTMAHTASAQSLTGSSPGFHYFHKTDATIEQHDEALIECAVATRGLINGSDAMTGIAASTGGGLVGALIGGVIDSNENRQGAAANTENCMAIKGWSVIGLSDEEGKSIEAFDDEPPTLREALIPYVESAEPLGPVLRGPFANELAEGNFRTGEALDLEEVSLSVRALKDRRKEAIEAAGELKPPKLPRDAPKQLKTINKRDYPSSDPQASYIALRMISSKRFDLDATSITLQRLDEARNEIIYDGAPTNALVGGSFSRKVMKTRDGDLRIYDFVIAVPPGIWKIASFSWAQYAVDLCFGAPAFRIGEQETLYLGEMTLSEAVGYPLSRDNIAAAYEFLGAVPEIAERTRFPAFENGVKSDCFGSYAYAYDIPEAPVSFAAPNDSDLQAPEGRGESTTPNQN